MCELCDIFATPTGPRDVSAEEVRMIDDILDELETILAEGNRKQSLAAVRVVMSAVWPGEATAAQRERVWRAMMTVELLPREEFEVLLTNDRHAAARAEADKD